MALQLPNLQLDENETPMTVEKEIEYPFDRERVNKYQYFYKLFKGDHFEAFKIKADDPLYEKTYAQLRYITVNFPALLSRIIADLLFSEPVTLKVPEDGDKEAIETLWYDNELDTQVYEMAQEHSFLGDVFIKIRTEVDGNETRVVIEDTNPAQCVPIYANGATRGKPREIVVHWKYEIDERTYVRLERHQRGVILNEVYLVENGKLKEKVGLSTIAQFEPGLVDTVVTGVDDLLMVHIPNGRNVYTPFGQSDYYDLDTLFFAVNNRLSKIDNILDKHSDPILIVPPGVLDENGQVNKRSLGVVEVETGEDGTPTYVTWDASLESAFKQLEKLIEMFYMVGEVSPDVLGLGKGVSDSGRALKYKMIRTLAKVQRKKLYFNVGIPKALYLAQALAKAQGATIGDKVFTGEPVYVQVQFADGLPNNYDEQVLAEAQAIDAELTTVKDAIKRIYAVDDDEAEQMYKEIQKEKPKLELPRPNFAGNDQTPDQNQNQQDNQQE